VATTATDASACAAYDTATLQPAVRSRPYTVGAPYRTESPFSTTTWRNIAKLCAKASSVWVPSASQVSAR